MSYAWCAGFDKKKFPHVYFQNNLNYVICIQRQWNYCSTTYSNEAEDVEYDFQLINIDSGEESQIFYFLGNELFFVFICENVLIFF